MPNETPNLDELEQLAQAVGIATRARDECVEAGGTKGHEYQPWCDCVFCTADALTIKWQYAVCKPGHRQTVLALIERCRVAECAHRRRVVGIDGYYGDPSRFDGIIAEELAQARAALNLPPATPDAGESDDPDSSGKSLTADENAARELQGDQGPPLPAFSEMSQDDYRAELRRYGWWLSGSGSRWSVNRFGCCGIERLEGEDPEAFDCRALRHARKQMGVYRDVHEVRDGPGVTDTDEVAPQ